MATKKPDGDKNLPPKERPKEKPKGPAVVKTQMQGESGDDDLGYDPSTIPTEDIPD